MKKQSFLAIGMSLSMVTAMAIPAFAANTNPNLNADGTAASKPGTGANQTDGQSYNAANMTSTDGTLWETVNDDDAVIKANDHTTDISVWATVMDAKTKAYKVDLAWGSMKFEYDSRGSTTWNTETHRYDKGTQTAKWTETYLNGDNNKVAVTNHSNNGIDATFAYKMDGLQFNDKAGMNNVIGNFFDTNTYASTAATKLNDTYTNATGTVNTATVTNTLAGSKVALPTAADYNDGTTNQTAGARTHDVFFAFSGTPDDGKGAALNNFQKVGTITVTVAPNNDAALN